MPKTAAKFISHWNREGLFKNLKTWDTITASIGVFGKREIKDVLRGKRGIFVKLDLIALCC